MTPLDRLNKWLERAWVNEDKEPIGWVETLAVLLIASLGFLAVLIVYIVTTPWRCIKRHVAQAKFIKEFITYYFK